MFLNRFTLALICVCKRWSIEAVKILWPDELLLAVAGKQRFGTHCDVCAKLVHFGSSLMHIIAGLSLKKSEKTLPCDVSRCL